MDIKSPELSAVVLTPDSFDTIRITVDHLRRQKAKALLELVIVAPRVASIKLDEELRRDFFSVQVIEVGQFRSTAEARAAGVRAATAPLVAFIEDHSFPAPGWASAFIRAHQEPWAAVGPIVLNANPASLISWANYLIEYAPWMGGQVGREIDHLPGHNSSYKRSILLDYGERLASMLEVETVLHWDLGAKGHRLYLEPGAVTGHLNYSATLSWIALQFHASRMFAGARARWGKYNAKKRLVYALATPLIPGLRLKRILRQLKAHDHGPPSLIRLVALLSLLLSFSAAGEMLGYLGWDKGAVERTSAMEFHRQRLLCPRDREDLERLGIGKFPSQK